MSQSQWKTKVTKRVHSHAKRIIYASILRSTSGCTDRQSTEISGVSEQVTTGLNVLQLQHNRWCQLTCAVSVCASIRPDTVCFTYLRRTKYIFISLPRSDIMHTQGVETHHSLWDIHLDGAVEPTGLQKGFAASGGHETSCYRVIFERTLFSFFKVIITIKSLFLNFEE